LSLNPNPSIASLITDITLFTEVCRLFSCVYPTSFSGWSQGRINAYARRSLFLFFRYFYSAQLET
jgi:hypothetical protein